MTKIYLIRHAEAEGNLYRIWQGHWNGMITPMGYQQIDALAERFKDIHLDALYSSDLSRTITTSKAITKYHNLNLQIDPNLREILCGPWEGIPFGNVAHDFPEQMEFFNKDPDKWHVDGAETFAQCRDRIVAALTSIAEKEDGKTIAVVSHGMGIRTVLAHFLGISSQNISQLPHGDNTAVSYLEYNNGIFTPVYYNDNSHLPVELSTFAKQTWWKNESKPDFANLRDEPFNPKTDASLYSTCYADAWRASHGSEVGYVASPYLTAAANHIKEDPRSVLKIYSLDDFVGILDTDPVRGRREGYGWISLIYLKEEYRNRNFGVQLLGRAICHYRDKGMKSIRLHVAADNEAAIAFYKKNNFRIINIEKSTLSDLLLMEKDII